MSHMHYLLQFTRINLSPPARGSFCLYSPNRREEVFSETQRFGDTRKMAGLLKLRLSLLRFDFRGRFRHHLEFAQRA
jgi:hypothetical protein